MHTGDKELVKIMKPYAVSGSVRFSQDPSSWPPLCLMHYAALMRNTAIQDNREREEVTIALLIQYKANLTGRVWHKTAVSFHRHAAVGSG